MTHLHPERQFLTFPQENFFQWAEKKGLTRRREGGRNVAYFAGCTAGYLFPEVGRATVEVLEHNGIIVYVPKQQCCGMPQLVEGNRTATLDQVQCNMENLLAAVQVGDDLVCSCPSCGYLMNEPIGSMTQFARKFLA